MADLHTLCQKRGKVLKFHLSSRGSSYTVHAIVDGMVIGTGYARQAKIAKLNAARDALRKLSGVEAVTLEEDEDEDDDGQNLHKQRLYVYCGKRRWMNPIYE